MDYFTSLLSSLVSILTIFKISIEIYKTLKDKKRSVNGRHRKRKK